MRIIVRDPLNQLRSNHFLSCSHALATAYRNLPALSVPYSGNSQAYTKEIETAQRPRLTHGKLSRSVSLRTIPRASPLYDSGRFRVRPAITYGGLFPSLTQLPTRGGPAPHPGQTLGRSPDRRWNGLGAGILTPYCRLQARAFSSGEPLARAAAHPAVIRCWRPENGLGSARKGDRLRRRSLIWFPENATHPIGASRPDRCNSSNWEPLAVPATTKDRTIPFNISILSLPVKAGSAELGCLPESRSTRHNPWPTHRPKPGVIATQKHPRSNLAFETDRLDADPISRVASCKS
ncbi:hypothetical protein FHS00_002979 [Limimaricola variabilis]|uniref:Uncharacterized protein n=1 Tax=Limimaricola variabilis TaxID=1492771 RepID=A0ABR6HSG6_9RHOB|nr:hypothetical protein [Limimaricola variabilis]